MLSPETDLGAFFQAIVDAIQGGQWRIVAVLTVIGLVYVIRRYGVAYIPWLGTVRGGAALALATGLVSTCGPVVMAGTPLSWKLLLDAILLGITAAGGWVVARRFIFGDSVPPNPQPPAP